MAGLGFKGDSIGVRIGLDAVGDLQGLQVKGDDLALFAVIGEALAGGDRDADSVRAARHAEHLAYQAAILAVNNGDAVSVRDIDPVAGGVIDHIVPPIRRAERHGVRDLVGGCGPGGGHGSGEKACKAEA